MIYEDVWPDLKAALLTLQKEGRHGGEGVGLGALSENISDVRSGGRPRPSHEPHRRGRRDLRRRVSRFFFFFFFPVWPRTRQRENNSGFNWSQFESTRHSLARLFPTASHPSPMAVALRSLIKSLIFFPDRGTSDIPARRAQLLNSGIPQGCTLPPLRLLMLTHWY